MSNSKRFARGAIALFSVILVIGCSGRGGSPNNPLVVDAPAAITVDEGAAVVSGQLTASDPDPSDSVSFSISRGGSAPAGFQLNSDGSYSFDPADTVYDHLSVGGSESLSIPVTADHGRGGTDTTQLDITINGTNDAPVAAAVAGASTDVDSPPVIGQLTSTDPDDGATATYAISGAAPDGFTLNADGSYSFNSGAPAYASLNVGDTQLVSIAVSVTDDQGASDSTQIDITVSGTNNVPVANADSYATFGNTLLEVGGTPSGAIAVSVTGSVLDNDVELDAGDSLTVSLETSPALGGSVSIDALGNFSYTPPAGQTAITDSFTYRLADPTSFAIGTVSIAVSERIWYVDNRSGSGDGTSSAPFATLGEAELAVGAGDTIYIANGDGTTLGRDAGLTLAVPNISVVGEGVALVISSQTLAPAGTAPNLTNTTGAGLTLNSADNTLILGLNIDGASEDGLRIDNASGIVIEGVTISNSGQSAIDAGGADVDIALTDVTIDTVDTADPAVSDDAIIIAATANAALTMQGGAIGNVPGSLGDGIVMRNQDAGSPVIMNLDVRGVTFTAIGQDAIKLDNDNGVMNVQIGGSLPADGNIIEAGFRGIQIQTDADPTSSRVNSITIQNNTITSASEGIQVRHIADQANLSILDNILSRAVPANVSDLIDVQSELVASNQARVNGNDLDNLGGSDGIRVRVLDRATLTMEARDNLIDGPLEGLDFDVIETDIAAGDATTLNISVLTNTLSGIGDVAMHARNANGTSVTCMDLQGNSTVADYVVDATLGTFQLTAASQTVVLAGGSVSDPGSCPVPTF